MRLVRVAIDEFKNLRDLHVNFDQESPYTVLVGENGAGKSNLIEALTLIFRNLDLDAPAPFGYEIEYYCRGNRLWITAAADASPTFRVKDEEALISAYTDLTKKRFMAVDESGKPLYRPAFVFGYYSGPSDRLASLYEKHKERFYNWIIKPPERRPKNIKDPNELRRLFYAQTLHGQFVLLAFFMEAAASGDDEDRAFLREHLQIDGLDSVLFVMNEPEWRRKNGGDERFWHAEGEVSQFLDRLYSAATLPMRMERRVPQEFTRTARVESLYLFLRDASALEQVYRTYDSQYEFFTALESTHLSKLLGEVRTRVRMTPAGGGGEVTYRDLSEGEQQLLLLLGLLKFTARDEALFLLDEPDTHLNPIWSTQYLTFLDRFIRMREREESCHIVMSSHDPLVFAGLKREQVSILRRGHDGRAIVDVPDEDPQGMGVAAILTSDLFRLRSTLDSQTQADLDRQRRLAVKEKTPEEEDELRQLNEFLHGKGLTQATRDPLYQLFVRAWTEREDPAWSEAVEFTPEQLRARDQLARELIAELRSEGVEE
ncbi:AAA family ATPase [Amycolatopsis dendrobii]|uniref:AAA family ATPase n=1 Tax=Amycolatopsis dendrobii TaxID=2760662 RepID=A0A7W3VSZ4_9PSEU|nr:AAA family ATPase [Amycolatopsis dendrobii]MBB1152509.1 AAA family ATPase [Amycolatopsis dendrobii]